MKHDELLNLRRIVNQAILKEYCDYVSLDDLKHLKSTLDAAIEESHIKRFLKHIEDAMPTTDDEVAWDKFYNKSFVITFDGQSAVFPMDATVYQNITDTIKEYIENSYCDYEFTTRRRLYGYMQRIKTDLQSYTDAEADPVNPDLDTQHLAIHDIKNTMSEIIDELLTFFNI